MEIFTENDWGHLHDVVLEATWETTKTKMSQDELEHLFSEFPESIKQDAYRWGLNDTVVRDKIYVWYKKNKLST